MKPIKILFFVLLLILGHQTFAETPSLDNISSSEFEGVMKDFSANAMHSPVSPPSSLGNIFGLELGAVLGATKAPNIKALSATENPGSDVNAIPHAGLLIAASFPKAISGEVTFIPTIEQSGVEFKTFTFGLKWAFSEYLGVSGPIKIAGRFHYGSMDLSYSDTLDGVNTTVSLDSTVWGAHITAGFKIPVLEPYIGIGFAKATSSLGASAGASIFDQSFTLSAEAEESLSTGHLFGGINFNLFLLKLGVEFVKAFSTTSVTGKVSLYF